jgi:hypothetical protein
MCHAVSSTHQVIGNWRSLPSPGAMNQPVRVIAEPIT